jgi:PKD repeat protein
MRLKVLWIITVIVSCLLLIPSFSVKGADVTIIDGTGDVCSIDYQTGESTVVTYSTYIDVSNLDITQATYMQQGTQANLSLQVQGIIEDRGDIIDPYNQNFSDHIDAVEYLFELSTSDQDYSVSYSNRTGQITSGSSGPINLTASNFSVIGDTLSVWFSLISADEIYESLSVTSTYIKANLSNISGLVYLSDVAPNPPLEISEAYAPNNGFVGEIIQFNGSVEPLTGQPPYTYHWDFGEGYSSTQQNPTHIYTNAGIYMYTFRVTDSANGTASKSGNITIHELKKAFLFGRYTNMSMVGDFFNIEAINVRMILSKPFQYLHFIAGEKITFSNQYNGIIMANHFLIGMFNVVILS